MSYLVFDTESAPIENATDFIKPAKAPANYVKAAAISEYVAKAYEEQLSKAALDVDLARIVAIGWNMNDTPVVMTARDEDEEHQAIDAFWLMSTLPSRPTLVGFNCIGFDLPLLLRRSLYLGIKTPTLQMGKYRHDGIVDLMLSLSFDGALKYRSLAFYAKRFALDVPNDEHSGADIDALVAAGDWDAVSAHCSADVATTVALAKRIGVL